MAPPIVKRFLISFDQNKWLGLLTVLLSLGIAGVVAMQPPPPPPRPTYKALGQLSFRTPPPTFTSTGTALQQQGRSVSRDVLLSPQVLQKVAQKLRLNVDQILEIRDKRLAIQFPNEATERGQSASPNVITLEYTDPESPTRATLILETLMNEMIEYSRWLNTSQLRGRIEALNIRLGQVQKDLTQAEERFYRYISREGSDLLAVQDGSLFSAITSSQQRQRSIQLSLQEIEGQIDSLSDQLRLNADQAYTSVALSADPIIASIRANILSNEQQLERLEKDLRPEHPTLIQLRKQQEVNETLLQNRAAELINRDDILSTLTPQQIRKDSNLDPTRQQLANQLVSLKTQRDGLIRQLDSVVKTERDLRQQYERFPDKQLQQARLVQAVEFQRVIYQNILTALVDAQSAEAETVSSLTVAQAPVVPPAQPYQQQRINRLLILGAGAGIGVVAGAGVILLLALIDDRLHTPEEIRDLLANREVLLLGQLPFIPLEDENSPLLVSENSVYTYLPFYERFRSNIRRLAPESSKVILVTSVTDEEGKSISAYNLAIASAHAGKRTLLVEADLRSSSKAYLLGILPEPEASIEPLRYYAARSDSIELVPIVENLYILPSPGPQRQAAAIVESNELQLLLKDVRGRFDMVIVDTPALSKSNDALLLEPLTDGIVLVARPGVTRSSLLGEAIDQFTEAEIPVLGAAINYVENLVVSPSLPAEALEPDIEQPQALAES